MGVVAGMTEAVRDPGSGGVPLPAVRNIIDGLADAIIVCDASRAILYANSSAERLLGWPRRGLEGQSASDIGTPQLGDRLNDAFTAFVDSGVPKGTAQPVPTTLLCRDGSHVVSELVVSVIDHPWTGTIAVVVARPASDLQLHRWGELSGELLELMASAPVGKPPAEQFLSMLGRRLEWDVTTLWGLTPAGEAVCHHVWTTSRDVAPRFAAERARDPLDSRDGMPQWVFEHGEPLWLPDLAEDERFMTETMRLDGMRSAYAFPIWYRGVCVGVVKMLSRRQRDPDLGLVELITTVGDQLGELLHAFTLATERKELVAELEVARRSQEFLLLASRVLAQAADYRQAVNRLAQIAVPILADLCLIDIRDEDGQIRRMAAWHADPSKRQLIEELRVTFPPDPDGPHPSVDVLRTGRSRWDAVMTDEFLAATTKNERHLAILKDLEFTSYMTVPLAVGDRRIGTVTLVSAGSGRRFTKQDLSAAEELARQVSSVVDRAQALDRERRISHELQQNLLPESTPHIEGWMLATRYLPAADDVEVGGDWYDAIPLGDTKVALVVGDVEGHNMEAAKVMGRLRHALSVVMLEDPSPASALERLNRFVLSTDIERIATVLVVVLDTSTGALRLASAGHLPAISVSSAGSTELTIRPGPPLGVPGTHYEETGTVLNDACLLLFTDGLVERRGRDPDEGIEQLRVIAGSALSFDPDRLADRVLAAMLPEGSGEDDVALLAVRRVPA
jgi:PAS domain S-box-containing protein